MEETRYKIVEKTPKQTISTANGEWDVQEVILEEIANVQYPNRYLVRFTGDNIGKIENINIGDDVKASWSANVRCYETKDGRKIWSQNLKGWKIEAVGVF